MVEIVGIGTGGGRGLVGRTVNGGDDVGIGLGGDEGSGLLKSGGGGRSPKIDVGGGGGG